MFGTSSSSERLSLLDATPVLDGRQVSIHLVPAVELNAHSCAVQQESTSTSAFAARGVSLYNSTPEPAVQLTASIQNLVVNTTALSLSEPSSRPQWRNATPETGATQKDTSSRSVHSDVSGQGVACSSRTSNTSCPPHGVKAVCGKRTKMEDAFAVLPNFCELPLNSPPNDMPDKLPTRIASQMDSSTHSSAASPSSASQQNPSIGEQEQAIFRSCSSSESSIETFHFFGVYDGHGGSEAADHCAKRLHQHLSEVLILAASNLNAELKAEPMTSLDEDDQKLAKKVAEDIAFKSLPGSPSSASARGTCSFPPEEPALDRPASPGPGAVENPDEQASTSESSGTDCCAVAAMLETSLRDAFLKTDAEFATDDSSALVGSTAVVALVGCGRIYVANCGDSRAVLARGGKAIQLTDDHKPEREDEAERVEKAGGQVLYWNGHRVMGILAMSRAIGDHCLRPYVIPEPEITVVNRTDEDELLLLASDGLWDVMSNQEASSLAGRCLQKARERGASRRAAARIAASVLTRAAIDRGSKDNVTVVIVDLSYCPPGEDQGRDDDGPSLTSSLSVSAESSLNPTSEARRGDVTLAAVDRLASLQTELPAALALLHSELPAPGGWPVAQLAALAAAAGQAPKPSMSQFATSDQHDGSVTAPASQPESPLPSASPGASSSAACEQPVDMQAAGAPGKHPPTLDLSQAASFSDDEMQQQNTPHLVPGPAEQGHTTATVFSAFAAESSQAPAAECFGEQQSTERASSQAVASPGSGHPAAALSAFATASSPSARIPRPPACSGCQPDQPCASQAGVHHGVTSPGGRLAASAFSPFATESSTSPTPAQADTCAAWHPDPPCTAPAGTEGAQLAVGRTASAFSAFAAESGSSPKSASAPAAMSAFAQPSVQHPMHALAAATGAADVIAAGSTTAHQD